jgi:hypothetical protein
MDLRILKDHIDHLFFLSSLGYFDRYGPSRHFRKPFLNQLRIGGLYIDNNGFRNQGFGSIVLLHKGVEHRLYRLSQYVFLDKLPFVRYLAVSNVKDGDTAKIVLRINGDIVFVFAAHGYDFLPFRYRLYQSDFIS